MDIICIGEALIDFKQTKDLCFKGFVGGSPLNVAIASARLGAKTAFAGQISTDLFGQEIRKKIIANHIDSRYLLTHRASSTLAFVAEVNGEAHFSFINTAAADTLYNPQPRPVFPVGRGFVMFGSISLLTEPAASAIEEVVRLNRKKKVIVFDPNVRPALIKRKSVYLKKLDKWINLVDIVKASMQDLEWLYPGREPMAIAEDWLKCGPGNIIITDGPRPTKLYRKNKAPLSSATTIVDVIDTVGAGDTFTGAVMVALLKSGSDLLNLPDTVWQEALDFASRAAALNCTVAGADPPDGLSRKQ